MLYKILTIHGNLYKKTISIGYTHLIENGGKWSYDLLHYKQSQIAFSTTIPQIAQLPILEFNKINTEVNEKLVIEIENFIKENNLTHRIDFISSNGIFISDDLYFEKNEIFAQQLALTVIGEFSKSNKLINGTVPFFGIAEKLLQINVSINDENKTVAIALLGALRWREAVNIICNEIAVIAGSIWLGAER